MPVTVQQQRNTSIAKVCSTACACAEILNCQSKAGWGGIEYKINFFKLLEKRSREICYTSYSFGMA